jgi:indolepyruvate ferredoxin oxidoreductase beta subunit
MTEPLSILIGALGGEGGGVLADWLTQTAAACGYPVQRTSIPGVAQRTGATSYYVEIFPVRRDQLGGKEVVLALSPVPGKVDVMVASELLEAARAVQNGMVSPMRTTLIASNHRIFTVIEKSGMGDGRLDDDALIETLKRFSQRAVLFDMEASAREAGTVISAVMLGAVAGSGALPLPRSAFEDAIRTSGAGAENSLKGFAAGFAAAEGGGSAKSTAPTAGLRARPIPRKWQTAIGDLRRRFPESLRALIEEGYLRQIDYQNRRYADIYAERVQRVLNAERVVARNGELPVTAACARFLALWMSYEDVICVADLKSRASRYRRVRTEIAAQPHDLVKVIEFMKPGLEEWCAVLPSGIARRLREWARRRDHHFNIELHIKTTSIHGALLLYLLASLRWWRPHTSRYAEEQRLIERLLAVVLDALRRSGELALELALCGRLIKGYGETHARGKANFLRILDTLYVTPAIHSDAERAAAIRGAREAALADPEGDKLEQSLAMHGIAPLIKTKPIVWHKHERTA